MCHEPRHSFVIVLERLVRQKRGSLSRPPVGARDEMDFGHFGNSKLIDWSTVDELWLCSSFRIRSFLTERFSDDG